MKGSVISAMASSDDLSPLVSNCGFTRVFTDFESRLIPEFAEAAPGAQRENPFLICIDRHKSREKFWNHPIHVPY